MTSIRGWRFSQKCLGSNENLSSEKQNRKKNKNKIKNPDCDEILKIIVDYE